MVHLHHGIIGWLLVSYLPSRVQFFVTLWAVAHQAPLSMQFPRQEYWSGLPFPSPGYLPDPGIEPASPAWQADPLPLSHLGSPYVLLQVIEYSSLSYTVGPCLFFHI